MAGRRLNVMAALLPEKPFYVLFACLFVPFACAVPKGWKEPFDSSIRCTLRPLICSLGGADPWWAALASSGGFC